MAPFVGGGVTLGFDGGGVGNVDVGAVVLGVVSLVVEGAPLAPFVASFVDDAELPQATFRPPTPATKASHVLIVVCFLIAHLSLPIKGRSNSSLGGSRFA